MKVEDFLLHSAIIYERSETNTTLLKGTFEGQPAVVKLIKVTSKEKAQELIDREVQM